MPQPGAVSIRDFQPDDLKQVADIMACSFRDEINKIASLPQERLPDFLIGVGLVYPRPFAGYIVADLNGEVVAVMILKWLYQGRPEMKLKLLEAMRYGLLTAIKLFISRRLFRKRLTEGECYIEYIAVKPEARHRGIGVRLLDYGRELALQQGLKKYTLHVASSNEAALKMYNKAGFGVVSRKRSLLSVWLSGVREWHYLVQDITHPVKP